MEIQHIREFLTLAKCGNYLAAAEELFISQSTLSKHIMSLEKEFGFSLFNRTTRKVHLTQYGEMFLPYAQRIIDADVEFRNEMTAVKNTVRDSIRLGVIPAFSAYHMEDAILEYKSRFPHFPLSLEEGSNEALISCLRNGTCNIILMRSYEDAPPPEIVTIPLLKDQLSLITLAGSPFDNGRTSLSWRDVQEAELLTSTSAQQTKMLAAIEEQMGLHFNIISRLSRTHSIIGMLRKGVGNAALLNKMVSTTYQNDLAFKILDITPPVYNTVYLAYMKDRPLTTAMRSFISLAAAYTAKGEFVHE